jgi:multidrug resistance efflux pump
MISGVSAGLLLLEDDAGAFAPAANWPLAWRDFTELVAPAERALRERRGVVETVAPGAVHVAYPIEVKGRLWGVVVLALRSSGDGDLQAALRQLHWGAGWVETLFHRRQAERDFSHLASAKLALQLVGAVGAASGLVAGALALANELATRLDCRRVAVGVTHRQRVRVLAISHAASLAGQSRLAASIANVMEEALDEGATCAYPPIANSDRRIAVAHRDHCRDAHMAAASVLIGRGGVPVGVITLERDNQEPFDHKVIAQCESVADLAAPIFQLHRDLHRPLTGRSVRWLVGVSRKIFGRGHPTLKLAAVIVVGLCVWLGAARGEYRISGKATTEGMVQRAAVAPFDGFIATAPFRAGDVVEQGQVLASLDTRELELDALRWESEGQQARLKQDAAENKSDRAESALYGATAAEAAAQLALVQDKLARARIVAPFRGLIVSGDLTQELGSPVERGKLLFEVAPLDRYRVIIKVDEREIVRVEPGATGHLLLDGLSFDPLKFKVVKTIPIAVAAEGGNTFRVEAVLDAADLRLRPGMEGVGKIDAGQAPLIWVWAHPIFDWLRIATWKWWP